MTLTLKTLGEPVYCQGNNCHARIATVVDERFRVKIGDQWVATSRPVSISCGRCHHINDFALLTNENRSA